MGFHVSIHGRLVSIQPAMRRTRHVASITAMSVIAALRPYSSTNWLGVTFMTRLKARRKEWSEV